MDPFRANMEQLIGSQGRNLALTVLYVPTLFPIKVFALLVWGFRAKKKVFKDVDLKDKAKIWP